MDELRRRYLQQLIELGEKDLVLSETAPLSEAAERGQGASEGALRAVRPSERPAPATPRPAPTPERPAPATPRPTSAPIPIGIIADAPARGDLFTADPIAALHSLEQIATVVDACRKCGLGHSRLHSVPGQGSAQARMVVVGEAPGATEDEQGLAFVGRAGKLLTDILKAIDLSRDEVFICNVLKCRPPDNRDPEPLEVAACSPYLHRQLELIRPKVVLAMGKNAARALLGTNAALGDLRQKVHRYRGIPLIVTYHPAALLRNPHWKRPTWDDIRLARRIFDDQAV